MGIPPRRHRHGRDVHRPRRRRRATRRDWFVAKVPSNPRDPVAALAAACEQAEFDPATCRSSSSARRSASTRVITRTRRARASTSRPRASRTSRSSSGSTARTTTTSHWRKPRAARRAATTASASTSGSTPTAPCSSPLDEGSTRSRDAAPAHGDGDRRGRRLLPLLLPEPRPRAARRATRSRRSPGAAGLALARGRADLARVRARHRGDPRRLPQADRRRATSPASTRRSRRQGVGGALVAAEVQRRPRAAGQGGASARRTCCCPGIAGGAHRRRATSRARAGAPNVDHARHGRDELRRLPDRRRRPAVLLRVRDRVRPAGRACRR